MRGWLLYCRQPLGGEQVSPEWWCLYKIVTKPWLNDEDWKLLMLMLVLSEYKTRILEEEQGIHCVNCLLKEQLTSAEVFPCGSLMHDPVLEVQLSLTFSLSLCCLHCTSWHIHTVRTCGIFLRFKHCLYFSGHASITILVIFLLILTKKRETEWSYFLKSQAITWINQSRRGSTPLPRVR